MSELGNVVQAFEAYDRSIDELETTTEQQGARLALHDGKLALHDTEFATLHRELTTTKHLIEIFRAGMNEHAREQLRVLENATRTQQRTVNDQCNRMARAVELLITRVERALGAKPNGTQ